MGIGSEMGITTGSRHQKIIGDFGEHLICNWLSRSGFEVVLVDHTGLDIVAYNPATGGRLGITVKSRTRRPGREQAAVNVFLYQKGKNDREKLLAACKAFACEPWIAVYVEADKFADLYLTSLAHYDEKYRGRDGRAIDDWKMTNKFREQYDADPEVKHIRISFEATHWWDVKGILESKEILSFAFKESSGET
jgi:Holliday junction resolvase